ncbi:MAG: hypothetical protein SFX74_00210 [Fimbriimonadaceae bacterium]|nr:hypothetical protein [Fimbriimonadaceae bacterium]
MIFTIAVVVLTCALSLGQAPSQGAKGKPVAGNPVSTKVLKAGKDATFSTDLRANLKLAEQITADRAAPRATSGTRSMYVERGKRESSNWLQKAFDTLRKIEAKEPNLPKMEGGPNPLITQIANVAMWTVLGGLLAYFGYVAIREIRIRKSGGRRAKSVLAEEEEALTLDEWLAMADELATAGKFREAVRCLYLACLMNYDAADVARFVRSETNWEHLARIEMSPRYTRDVDFRAATKAFDLIWYGFRVDGMTDVDRFRTWYSSVRDANERLRVKA